MKLRPNNEETQKETAIAQGVIAGTADNMNMSAYDSAQPLSGDKVSDDLTTPPYIKSEDEVTSSAASAKIGENKIPHHFRLTVGWCVYVLAVLSLAYLIHSYKPNTRYKPILKISETAKITSPARIVYWFKMIIQAGYGVDNKNDDESKKLLADILDLKKSMVLRGCVETVLDFNITPHHFKAVKGWENVEGSVLVHNSAGDTSFDGFRTGNYLYWQKLYPFYDDKQKFLITDAVTSVMTDVVLYCFKDIAPDLGISSSGGKSALVSLLDFTKIFSDKSDIKFVDGCARTAVLPLNNANQFSEIHLNDADKRFYNYLICVQKYPLYVVESILRLEYDNDLVGLRNIARAERERFAEDDKRAGKKLSHHYSTLYKIKSLMESRCNRRLLKSAKKCIESAANLLWWVKMSYCGSFESGIASARIDPNLNSKFISGIISASLALQKATISCMDCLIFVRDYLDDSNAFIFWDPPYMRSFSADCNTYKVTLPDNPSDNAKYIADLKPFGIKKIDEILLTIANAKCMSMFTHSVNAGVDCDCYTAGLEYLFEYDTHFGTNVYTTNVYCNNISERDFVRLDEKKYNSRIDEEKRLKYSTRAAEVRQMKADNKEGGEDND